MKKINILGIPFVDTTKKEFVSHVLTLATSNKEPISIVTANPEIVMLTKENAQYAQYVQQSTYVVADGIGVVIGSKILGSPLRERIPGYELVHAFMKNADVNKNRFFFYGGKPGIAEAAAKKAIALYPHINIVGTADGYGDRDAVATQAASSKPDFIFIATGAPKQEEWIASHRHQFEHCVMMGVGGSLDVLSGNVRRAPQLFIKLNLEWFYRLITQPTRIKRMMKIPLFLLKVLQSK